MNYLSFISHNRRTLSFGFLTALSSSFGQTFFLSLFLPYFVAEFALTEGGFGFVYGAATLGAAFLLPWLGGRIDGADLAGYTKWTLVGLAASAALVAAAPHVSLLLLGILGLRLAGNGLLGHISQTVMAREFGAGRGKALGVAGLGFALGEATLPLATALALGLAPWRWLWAAVAAGLALAALPLALRLLRGGLAANAEAARSAPAPPRRALLRDGRLYLALPAILAPAFVMTGLFLYQAPLSSWKGWRPEWMAGGFALFAVVRALTSVSVGPLIDRWSAARLLPLFGLPLGMGAALLYLASEPWAALAYLALAGVTGGANGGVISAALTEMYGPEQVGRARSMVASLAIVSAAGAPALMGLLIRLGVGFGAMLAGATAVSALCALAAAPLASRAALDPETEWRLRRPRGVRARLRQAWIGRGGG